MDGRASTVVKQSSADIVTAPVLIVLRIHDQMSKTEVLSKIMEVLPDRKPFFAAQIDPHRDNPIRVQICLRPAGESKGWVDIRVRIHFLMARLVRGRRHSCLVLILPVRLLGVF